MSAPADVHREAEKDRRALRSALVVVAVAAALRLALAALLPLFPDETYYWEWSRRLAGGYFDHPYGIAVLVRAGTALLGETPLGVRLFPVLAGVGATLAAVGIARRIGGGSAALTAAVVVSAMPLAATGLVLATPDAPLLAASAAALYAVVRALEAPARSRASLGWWTAAGVALGLAFSSKFTAVLLPAGVLVAVASRPALRPRLAEPGPYVACVVATLVFLPVLVWNARHDWIAFTFQIQHGLGGERRGSVLQREGDLLGGQAGLVSPILFVLMAVAIWRALRGAGAGRERGEGARPERSAGAPPDNHDRALRRPAHHPSAAADRQALLATVSLFVFAFFAYSALKKKVEPNWPAPAYLPAAALVAAHAWSTRGRRWLRAGWMLAAALSFLVYVHALTPIIPGLPARRDPVARAFGWDALAAHVHRARAGATAASDPAAASGRVRAWVAADRYQEASEIAFHLPDHPPVFALNLSGRRNQYDLWPRFADGARGGDALVVVLDERGEAHPAIRALAPHFAQVARGERIALRRGDGIVTERRIWVLTGWRGTWPSPPTP